MRKQIRKQRRSLYIKKKIRGMNYNNMIDISCIRKIFIIDFVKFMVCLTTITILTTWKDVSVVNCPVDRICEYIEDNSFVENVMKEVTAFFIDK